MSAAAHPHENSAFNRNGFANGLRSAMEVLVLAMTALAPWAFGAVHPASILLLYLGLSLTLLLWSAAILIERRVTIKSCPVLLSLGGMVALGVWQIIPLNPQALQILSVNSASLRNDLYPQQPEGLLGEKAIYPPTWTISFDPSATRARVVQLLALLALFSVVRFAAASPGAFRRLAIVCTVNGALLSILALAQRFSSSPETIYWIYPCLGSAYGPFVCKNNYPDYVNVCLFMGVGLLLRTPAFRHRAKSLLEWLTELGQNPTTLWLLSAVGLMVTGIMFSMSRGGAIALAGGAIACLVLTMWTNRFSASLRLLTLVTTLAVGAMAFFGVDAIGERLGTLAGNDPNQSRRELWARTLPLVGQFPIFGTGFGTFETIEPQTRQPGDERVLNWEHAHNDYLEVLIEGGFVNLSLLLLVVVFAYRSGIRAFNRLRNHPDGALAIGGLCGFTAVVLHSFGDFGMHIPAVAVLVTVLLAHLRALGDFSDSSTQTSSRWLALSAIATWVIVAIVLPFDGWFRERADYYRLASVRAGNRLPPGERDAVIRYLSAAAEFAPGDPAIRLRLADSQYEEYLARRKDPHTSESRHSELMESHLRPALRNYLLLRAMNPLFAEPHARLAGSREFLQHPDSVKNYLDRATRLRPTEEGLWYLAGLEELNNGNLDRAWDDWRQSLTCFPSYLTSISASAIARLGPEDLVDRVIPPIPELLHRVALSPPLTEKLSSRRLFASRAADRIAGLSLSRTKDLYARAWLLREAGRVKNAITAYEAALLQAPTAVEWRLELAELLYENRDYERCESHLRLVLRERPESPEARELNKALARARNGAR